MYNRGIIKGRNAGKGAKRKIVKNARITQQEKRSAGSMIGARNTEVQQRLKRTHEGNKKHRGRRTNRPERNSMRINITMKEQLVKKVDDVARQMGVSRSAFLAIAAARMIQSDKAIELMPELVDAVKMIVEHDRSNNDGSEGDKI